MPRISKTSIRRVVKRKRLEAEEDDEKEEEVITFESKKTVHRRRRHVSEKTVRTSVAKDTEAHDDSGTQDSVAKPKWTCNRIRARIRKYLLADGNTKASFRRDIGDVSPWHFNNFMQMKGPWDGRDNVTFQGATQFFLRLEKQKQDEAAAKKLKAAAKKHKTATSKQSLVVKSKISKSSAVSVSKESSGDESEEFTPKWTCNCIRGKIRKYLDEGNSQAAFRSELGDVSVYFFRHFMKMTGAWDGTDNCTFKAATQFFLSLEDKKLDKTKAKKKKGKKTVSKPSKASKSTKRSAAADESGEYGEEFEPKWTCNTIRGKIRTYLSEGHTQATFRKAIGDANANSFDRFMKLKGPWEGQYNCTFQGATRFFLRLQKEKRTTPPTKSELAAAKRKEKEKKAAKKEAILALVKSAEDEGYEAVGVLDDCNEIRKKINAFLAKEIMNRAEFLRAIGGADHKQLNSFLGQPSIRGAGAKNKVYRLSYHFFEKLRIAEGKSKTKKRLKNEAEVGTGGFPLEHDNGMRYVSVGKHTELRKGRIVVVPD